MGEPPASTRIVGARLLALRTRAGLTQEVVCEAVQISESYLSRLEQGRYTSVTLDIAGRLARYYRVSLDYLVGRTSKESVEPNEQDVERYLPQVWTLVK